MYTSRKLQALCHAYITLIQQDWPSFSKCMPVAYAMTYARPSPLRVVVWPRYLASCRILTLLGLQREASWSIASRPAKRQPLRPK